MRIMAIDLGSKTCGVAVSDELMLLSRGIEVIRRKEENKLRRTLARIEELVKEYNIEKIVVGYPKNIDGSLSNRCKISEEFAKKVESRTKKEVILWDEVLTTVSATELMKEVGMDFKTREKFVDQIAAEFILEDFLNNWRKK